ncbi:ABC transporter permease subunit [[Mycoplasma] collis]|uniref:ABC transporter permease subunit n=1 Tax=[Mycoplasma] collis TaxID=2127 RepID=UPI0012EC23F1|nr:ABC transporter permease subunit [[Mycoplasma] collis]
MNKNFYFLWLFILLILIFVLTYFSFSKNNVNYHSNQRFIYFLKEIFKYKNKSSFFSRDNLLIYSLEILFNSFKITIGATFLGFSLAVLTSFFSSEKIHNNWFSKIFRFLIIFLRALPVIIFATILKKIFDPNEALFWIYFWFTWLWIHKYLSDIINNYNLESYYLSLKLGNNKYKAFYNEILLKIKSRIFSLYFYSLESNFRWISLLGSLGISGIGALIYIPISSDINNSISEITIPLTVFMSFLIINEIFSFLINHFLFEKKYSFSNKTKINSLKYNFRFLLILFLFIITLAIFIWSILDLEKNYSKIFLFTNFFSRLMQINFKTIFSFNQISPLPLLFKVIWQSFIITIYVSIFGLFLGIFQSQKINNKFQSLILKIFSLIVRIIPFIVLFFIFDIYWFDSFTTIFLLTIFLNSFSFSKIVSTMVDKIDIIFYDNLKKQGYSYFKIIFIFIIPFIKKELIIQILFLYENISRSVIVYGVFSSGINLGSQIQIYTEREQFSVLSNYLLPIIIFFISLEYISIKLKKNKVKKIKLKNNFLAKLKF